jgi:regulator of protease activity HflC (stomatin/prohibitin superfamily)
MKHRISVAALVPLLLGACTYIEPGNVGVVIHRGGGGVDPEVLNNGVHGRNPFVTGIVEYPVSMQTLVLAKNTKEGNADDESISVNTVEGQPINMDVSLSYTLDPSKVPFLYKTFRQSIDNISYGYVRQSIRASMQEVIGQDSVSTLLGRDKGKMMAAIQKNIEARLVKYGFMVQQFTVNEIRPPQGIINAINARNEAQQHAYTAQNELQTTIFHAQRDSIEAAGQAKANDLIQRSITKEYIEYLKIQKWDGHLPTVSTGSAGVLLNMGDAAK